MARFVPGKWRGGVVHCYPLSFAVKANITVIRGNCGRTNREPAKEGRHRRHLFAASQTVNFPGTSDCLASNTQSEIARQRSTTRPAWLLPSFLPSVRPMRPASFSPTTFRSVRKGRRVETAETKQIALLRPALSFSARLRRWRLNDLSDGKIAWKWIIQILRLALLLCMENYQQQPPHGEGRVWLWAERASRGYTFFLRGASSPWNWVVDSPRGFIVLVSMVAECNNCDNTDSINTEKSNVYIYSVSSSYFAWLNNWYYPSMARNHYGISYTCKLFWEIHIRKLNLI